MYLPFPDEVAVSDIQTAHLPADECNTAVSLTQTASFTHPKSTVQLPKKDNIVLKLVNRPTDGNWRKIKESGSIKMTPMSIVNETATHNVAQVQVPFCAYKTPAVRQHRGKLSGSCSACQSKKFVAKLAMVRGRYVEQGDLDYWKSKYPDAPHYLLGSGTLDTAKLEAAKSSVYAELFQAYNLGEEIAELRETIALVSNLMKNAVSLILDSKKVIDSLLRKRKQDLAGDKWMEFRYGIMPIIFSIQDILALKNESGVYRTTRATVYAENEVIDSDNRPSVYFEDVGLSEVRATITAKARWRTPELKKMDLVNVNLLTTTTAVLPWSMVIRWFFNVQSFLDCRVKSLTSLALEHDACVAIREKRDYGTYLSIHSGYDHILYQGATAATCGAGYNEPIYLGRHTDLFRQDVLVSWYTVDNYNRYLFQPSDVKLVFSPHMTWQRAIDAMVMMMRPMSKLLRRLK